jgi:hypothetical protein
MICEILTACHEASTQGAMLTIDRAFNRVMLPFLPCVLEEVVIAVRVRSTSEEDGPHSFQLSLTELDGNLLGPPAEAQFETKSRDNEEYTWTQPVIRIPNILIPGPNDYLLTLQIDGCTLANTTIYVTGKKEGGAPEQGQPARLVRLK